MDTSLESYEQLIRSAAQRLQGHQRRLFQAEVTTQLGAGHARQAERRFGWGRRTVTTGLHEAAQGIRCLENCAARGRPRSEVQNARLAADLRAIVEPPPRQTRS